MSLKKIGGKVIEGNSKSCIFRPQLNCIKNNSKDKNRSKKSKNKISKLLRINRAISEIVSIDTVKDVLITIPNYKNYFIIDDIYFCSPKNLTKSDLIDFKYCEYNGITKENINRNLKEFASINSPYGGNNLIKILSNLNKKEITFEKYNNLLIALLINAILPMNKRYLYHFDIKPTNLLYKNDRIRLIDWEIAGLSNKNGEVPLILGNLYFNTIEYNWPFSILLFSNDFNRYLNLILNKPSFIKNLVNLEIIVSNYFLTGNFNINLLLNDIISKEIFGFWNQNMYIKELSYYCALVLNKYIKNRVFHKRRFFREIYSKNVDIYGIISCYLPFLDHKINYLETFYNKKSILIIKENIRNLIKKYYLNNYYSINPIPINKLIQDLKNIQK